MEIQVGSSKIMIVEGDITKIRADGIVNAANSALRGGGGVDGAIHSAGGPTIMKECREIGTCPPGEAVLSTAGRLPAKKVIHTVGPIWRGGTSGEEEILKNAYVNSLRAGDEEGLESMAFPSISTGAYGYPLEKAAHTAIYTVKEYLEGDTGIKKVIFVLYGTRDYGVYRRILESLQE
jgi:O-acetyl-ADP-ribose deacetylase (regulator of RNase III)